MEQKNLYDIQMERFKIFKTQNPAEFDVVFEIDGKKLYADKFKLRTISKTFDAMFLKRQNALPRRNYYKTTTPTKVDEAFKIQNFNFDDFNKFITFIYSGECQFTFCNIAALITISEVYQVQIFKNACEQFLLNYTWNFNNVYHIFELAYKHSMVYLKNSLLGFVSKNVLTFIGSLNFLNLQKAIVYDVVESNEDTLRQEELFEKVYKWAENQASLKQKSDKSLNLNEAIKKEFSDILPFFKYHFMDNEFLLKFVVSKSFLFSGVGLSDILIGAKYAICVIDANGKVMKGVLKCSDNEKMFQIIQSQKDICFETSSWNTVFSPILKSKLTKKNCVEWYLVYHGCYMLNVMHSFSIKFRHEIKISDVLLAEMVAENGFELKKWKFV